MPSTWIARVPRKRAGTSFRVFFRVGWRTTCGTRARRHSSCTPSTFCHLGLTTRQSASISLSRRTARLFRRSANDGASRTARRPRLYRLVPRTRPAVGSERTRPTKLVRCIRRCIHRTRKMANSRDVQTP